jgi:ring-1,2-phenylacetyl-CoA epoxidase subunit PaaD
MVTAPVREPAAVWTVLDRVMDPEVPVLSVVELGIVRDVELDERGQVTIDITPTYTGCPALQVIQQDITAALRAAGWLDVRVRIVYAPAWTTEWIGAEARKKLTAYGIAPPPVIDIVPLRRAAASSIVCPYCGSHATTVRSEFGTTSCKSVMFCDACLQPFELFKAI